MISKTNAVAFRHNLGEMINRVQYRGDSVVISKDGRPVAVLIDARLFDRIRRMQDRFELLATRLAEAYAEVPVEEGLAEIALAAAEARREYRRRRPRARKG